MEYLKRMELEDRLTRTGKIRVNRTKVEWKGGLVYVDGDTGNLENPMTLDTFTHHYLYNIEEPFLGKPKVLETNTVFEEEER